MAGAEKQPVSLVVTGAFVLTMNDGREVFAPGAVVVRDVPAYGLLVGNPARLIGWVCVCGQRLAFVSQNGPGNCPECQRTYTKSGEEVTLNESSPIVGSASPVRAAA